MSLALMIHKFAMLITLLIGILFAFKKSKVVKNAHYLSALVFVCSIFIYLIQTKGSSLGYFIYGLLLLLVFFSPKIFKNRGKLLMHISLFSVAICWLVIIHIV